jgi:hypothetical protein
LSISSQRRDDYGRASKRAIEILFVCVGVLCDTFCVGW